MHQEQAEELGETDGDAGSPTPGGGLRVGSASRPVNVVPAEPSRGCNSRRELAAEGFASGMNQREAARHAGVSDRSVRRWQADPQFNARVRELQDERFERVGRRLQGLLDDALDAVEQALADGADPRVRLQAALAMLRLGRAEMASMQISDRIARVEQQLDEERRWLDARP